jgi:hypothetical protein
MNIIAIENGWLVQGNNQYLTSSIGEGFYCATKEDVAEYVKAHLQTKQETMDAMYNAKAAEEKRQYRNALIPQEARTKAAGVSYAG